MSTDTESSSRGWIAITISVAAFFVSITSCSYQKQANQLLVEEHLSITDLSFQPAADEFIGGLSVRIRNESTFDVIVERVELQWFFRGADGAAVFIGLVNPEQKTTVPRLQGEVFQLSQASLDILKKMSDLSGSRFRISVRTKSGRVFTSEGSPEEKRMNEAFRFFPRLKTRT